MSLPVPPIDAVVAGATEQRTVTVSSADHVVTATAVDRVIAAVAQVDGVGALTRGNKHVVVAAGHVQPGAVRHPG